MKTPQMVHVILPDEEATLAFASRLGRILRAPMTVALSGPLGAGKTTLAGGLIRALGHRGAVPSPTFAMVNEYRRLKPVVYHMDLYRAGPEDLPGLALEEYFRDEEAVCVVEWAENAGTLLPADRLDITLGHFPDGRSLGAKARGPRAAALLARLK